MFKTETAMKQQTSFAVLPFCRFEFVSNFEIRISYLTLTQPGPRGRARENEEYRTSAVDAPGERKDLLCLCLRKPQVDQEGDREVAR